jgi:2-polyprenyl-3-methyl-5-hydroxy-6-metoxy-1,4-benzoquinol methylase
MSEMKILVVIANYGVKNDKFLSRLLAEYRSMPYHVDIVVLSNLQKDFGRDVEVVVGLPDPDPWSLPFGHKRIFADRQDAYDLFIYTEDDMLITQRNIEAFLRASKVLSPEELVGFFQWESYPDGRRYFPAVHAHFRWIPGSVRVVGEYTFARFTNEHSACYLLSKNQLKRAVASGGFVVGPHQGRYHLPETASTDPYTQCGFTKLLCLSHFEDFLVAHLPNRYAGSRKGSDAPEFERQMNALLRLGSIGSNGMTKTSLLDPETRLFHGLWSKDYYEPCREDMLALLPANTRTVLSIGTGWGATEEALVKAGVRVLGIPLDPVIAACAESRGVEIIYGDLDQAFAQLAGQRFDGVLISNILHLISDPLRAVRMASSLLAENGTIVASSPNLARLPFIWRRLRYPARYKGVGDHQRSGMHAISRARAKAWFRASGLKIIANSDAVPPNWTRTVALSRGLARPLFSSEYIVAGRKIGLREHA